MEGAEVTALGITCRKKEIIVKAISVTIELRKGTHPAAKAVGTPHVCSTGRLLLHAPTAS